MALSFIAATSEIDDKVEDAEIELAAADDEEAKNLPLHTVRCKTRFRYTVLRLNRIDRKLFIMSLLIGTQILISLLSSDKAHLVWTRVWG